MKNSNIIGKRRETDEVKQAKSHKNTARKEFENAIKTKQSEVNETKQRPRGK